MGMFVPIRYMTFFFCIHVRKKQKKRRFSKQKQKEDKRKQKKKTKLDKFYKENYLRR